MKKNALQKVLATTLAGTMVLSLAACGDSATTETATTEATTETTTTETTTTETATTEATTEEATVAGIEGFTAFDETVTLRIPIYQRATPNGAADAADNYWTNWVQENFGDQYNIDVEYVALTRGEENTAYALAAADGTLPVVCFEYDYPDVAMYYNEGYYQSYDVDWFKQIAPTYWAMMEENGLDQYTTINDENIFLIGERAYGNTNYQFVTFYRLDWVKAAGYDEMPSDPDEVLEMYAKIYELGLCGDHILGGTQTGTDGGVDQNYSYRTYPQDELTRAQQGDYSIPALTLDAQKALLKKQNQLYNLGYIDDEYNTRESSYGSADFINGDTISYSCYSTNTITVLDEFYAANPDAELAICVNHGPETYSDGSCNAFRPNGIFGEYIGFSATATEDEMKAFAMYLEWMIQPEILETLQWGIEGVNYEVVDGEKVYLDQTGIAEQQGHNNNVDMWCLVAATKTSGSVDDDIKAITPLGYPQSDDFFTQIKENYEGQVACYEAGLVALDPRYVETIESEAEYKSTLCAKYAVLRDQIVMGSEEDFEANYAAACEEYLAAGYQEILDERTEAYENGNVQ